VLQAFANESVEMVLTDPPYGVGYRGRWDGIQANIVGDEDAGAIVPAFAELWRILKRDSFCISFYGWPDADIFLSAWKLIGFRPVSHLVCVKSSIGFGHFSRNQHETAYLLAKGHPHRPERARSDVFRWEREPCLYHPTQKPISVIASLIDAFTDENATILDPFSGSGTTLVAARALGRRAIGIEIEERYCRATVERLAQQVFDFSAPTLRED
jgi:DNA modification methylase